MAKLSDFPRPQDPIEVAHPSWECAPVGVTRDSDALNRANFDALCDRLDEIDPYGATWEILRFGHFAVGWIEEVFVEPGSRAHAILGGIRAQLAEYPVLDEELWYQYDAEDAEGQHVPG